MQTSTQERALVLIDVIERSLPAESYEALLASCDKDAYFDEAVAAMASIDVHSKSRRRYSVVTRLDAVYNDGVLADYDDSSISGVRVPSIDAEFFEASSSSPLPRTRRRKQPVASKPVKPIDRLAEWLQRDHFKDAFNQRFIPQSLQDVLEIVTMEGDSWFDLLSVEDNSQSLTLPKLVVSFYDGVKFYFNTVGFDAEEQCYVFNANGDCSISGSCQRGRHRYFLYFISKLETIAVSHDDLLAIVDNQNAISKRGQE